MSSPCLLPAARAPISQPRLREVKISLKAGSRETAATRSGGGGTKEASGGRPRAPAEKEAAARVGASRSRSMPPVHRAQRAEGRKAARGGGGGGSRKQQEPERHAENNGALLHIPLAAGPSPLSSSSSSSSSGTPRRQRPAKPPTAPLLSSSSSSTTTSSTSAKSMKRARWLSFSTSNICFNTILDGRFRQLQGTGVLMEERCVCVCVCV